MPRPLLLAHRGHRAAGPENSLRSVVAAFSVADGAEVDVLVTADGVPVLRHDETLDDGTPVRSFPLAALRSRLGADADDLPTVSDVLAALPSPPPGLLDLELKVPGAARALLPLRDRLRGVVLTSFYASEVLDALALFAGVPTGLLADRAPVAFVPPGASLLCVHHEVLPAVRASRPSAVLWAWTVNDAAALSRALAARCAAIVGDDVVSLRRLLPTS